MATKKAVKKVAVKTVRKTRRPAVKGSKSTVGLSVNAFRQLNEHVLMPHDPNWMRKMKQRHPHGIRFETGGDGHLMFGVSKRESDAVLQHRANERRTDSLQILKAMGN